LISEKVVFGGKFLRPRLDINTREKELEAIKKNL
jgi:hypothetical protein